MSFTKNLHTLRMILAVPAAMAGALPAAAQVIQIEDDGSYVVRDGPAVTTADDVQPIREPVMLRPAMLATPAPAASGTLEGVFRTAASEFGVDPRLLHAVAWHESRFRQDAVSPKGAVGVMQLMPDTARTLGVNPFDVVQNVRGGAALLARLLREFSGDVRLTLAAYNAGSNSVRRYRGVPPFPETQSYVADIMQRLSAMAPGD